MTQQEDRRGRAHRGWRPAGPLGRRGGSGRPRGAQRWARGAARPGTVFLDDGERPRGAGPAALLLPDSMLVLLVGGFPVAEGVPGIIRCR